MSVQEEWTEVSAHIWRNNRTQQYFFSDETESQHGPYKSEVEAGQQLKEYVKWLELGFKEKENES